MQKNNKQRLSNNNKSQKRKWTIYEKNQLYRYGIDLEKLSLIDQHKPVEYITGYCSFLSLEIKVNQSVLIPRIETEELSILLKELYQKFWRCTKIEYLDVGTGSGAIALGFLYLLNKNERANIQLTATDISLEALQLATENFTRYQKLFINKPRMIVSDLLKDVPRSVKYHLVSANLPYVAKDDLSNLNPSVIKHEPILALDGGVEGWQLIEEFLIQIKDHIDNNCIVVLEVDHRHNQQFVKENSKVYSDWHWSFLQDSFGRNRFIVLRLLV